MKSEFEIAITQLSSDRNLSPEVILEAIEVALVSAYKRNFGTSENVSVTIHPHTGEAQVFVKKAVVDEVEDEFTQMTIDEAHTLDPDVELGGFVDIKVKPRNFGRIAAQTAKQVITQRIREAERDSVYLEYVDRVGEIVTGTVRNIDSRSRNVVLSLGKAEVVLPRSEQIPREHYRFSQRLRVYIVSVDRGGRGPQITVSRANRDLLRRLLELEVPEIFSGTVEIKAIAREPGFRSKVAVHALQAGIDPVGSCVGMRGVRIQNIVNELNGEKIDVVAWSPELKTFIANSLSPAKVVEVNLNAPENTARVTVPDRSLSLAIGKEGQNARLAAKLTGWRIDIKSETEAAEDAVRLAAEMEVAARLAEEREEARLAAAELLAEAEASLEPDGTELPEEDTEGAVETEAVAVDGAVEDETEPQEDTVVEVAAVEAEDVVGQVETTEVAATDAIETTEPAEAEEGIVDLATDPVAAEAQEPPAVDELASGPSDAPITVPEAVATGTVATEAEISEAVVTEGEVVEPEQEPGELADDLIEEDATVTGEMDDESVEDDALEMVELREDEANEGSPRPARSRKDRRLEFDEELGRVVARKRRKPSRRQNWAEDWDEED